MKLIDVILKKDMNENYNCKDCMLCWVEWSGMYEDCDCGCMMQRTPYNDMYGGWYCLMPKAVKQVLKKRYKKLIDKETEDYCRFVESQMESEGE